MDLVYSGQAVYRLTGRVRAWCLRRLDLIVGLLVDHYFSCNGKLLCLSHQPYCWCWSSGCSVSVPHVAVEPVFSSMASERLALESAGLSESVVRTTLAATRGSSRARYDARWAEWVGCCNQRSVSPFRAPVALVWSFSNLWLISIARPARSKGILQQSPTDASGLMACALVPTLCWSVGARAWTKCKVFLEP